MIELPSWTTGIESDHRLEKLSHQSLHRVLKRLPVLAEVSSPANELFGGLAVCDGYSIRI